MDIEIFPKSDPFAIDSEIDFIPLSGDNEKRDEYPLFEEIFSFQSTKKRKFCKQIETTSCDVTRTSYCPFCEKTFQNVSNVRRHLSKHDADPIVFCCRYLDCNHLFRQKGNRDKHEFETHGTIGNTEFNGTSKFRWSELNHSSLLHLIGLNVRPLTTKQRVVDPQDFPLHMRPRCEFKQKLFY